MRCVELGKVRRVLDEHRLAIQQARGRGPDLIHSHDCRHSPTTPARRDPRRDAGHAGDPAHHDDGHRADLPGRDRRAQRGPGLPGAGRPASPARLDDPLRPERRDGQVDAAEQPQEQPGLLRVRRERVRRRSGRGLATTTSGSPPRPPPASRSRGGCGFAPLTRSPTCASNANQLAQPITITSEYAEIIYFLRNGNLYRRVLLVAPALQSTIEPAVDNVNPNLNSQSGAGFFPVALGGNPVTSAATR